MCHIHLKNNKINQVPEKCLCVVYSDNPSSVEELLDEDGSITMHTINLQVLTTEMFKVYRNLSPTIVAEFFFTHQNNYNLRHFSFFPIPYVKTVYHCSESLSSLGLGIWNLVASTFERIR